MDMDMGNEVVAAVDAGQKTPPNTQDLLQELAATRAEMSEMRKQMQTLMELFQNQKALPKPGRKRARQRREMLPSEKKDNEAPTDDQKTGILESGHTVELVGPFIRKLILAGHGSDYVPSFTDGVRRSEQSRVKSVWRFFCSRFGDDIDHLVRTRPTPESSEDDSKKWELALQDKVAEMSSNLTMRIIAYRRARRNAEDSAAKAIQANEEMLMATGSDADTNGHAQEGKSTANDTSKDKASSSSSSSGGVAVGKAAAAAVQSALSAAGTASAAAAAVAAASTVADTLPHEAAAALIKVPGSVQPPRKRRKYRELRTDQITVCMAAKDMRNMLEWERISGIDSSTLSDYAALRARAYPMKAAAATTKPAPKETTASAAQAAVQAAISASKAQKRGLIGRKAMLGLDAASSEVSADAMDSAAVSAAAAKAKEGVDADGSGIAALVQAGAASPKPKARKKKAGRPRKKVTATVVGKKSAKGDTNKATEASTNA